MKKIFKKIIYKLYANDYENIISIIENYNCISFDIFDTLIKRNLKKPYDIFELIEKNYNHKLINFKKNRLNAEKIARKKSKYEDVNLNEIYKELNYPDDVKKELYNLEIKTEIEYCTVNKDFFKIYEYCVKNNKQIFFTSDMYLPKKIIEKILEENGYKHYKELYLSNDKRFTKISGNIFRTLIKEHNINANEIVHIGDSFIGDYLGPKKVKIKPILIKKDINKCLFLSPKNKTLDYNILSSFINNHINISYDDYEKFGYEVFGPILYSFTTWLHEKIKADKIDKVYFLARDAKIIMEVYKERFKEELPLYYLHISRKAMLNTVLNELNNLDDIFKKFQMMLKDTSRVKDLFLSLNLNYEDYKENLGLNKISDKNLILELSKNQKAKIFTIIKTDLYKKSELQKEYLSKYLEQNKFNGRIAIVDIGWNGTIQYYLQTLNYSNAQIFGYYYGVNNDDRYKEYETLYRYGFLFTPKTLIDNQRTIQVSLGIFEMMFLSSEGSTISYAEKKGKIIPIYAEKDNNFKNSSNIKKIQNSAQVFVKDAVSNNLSIKDCNVCFENYKNFIQIPTIKNINLFKNIEFLNNDKHLLINNKSLIYYLFHLKEFYIDLKNSDCKIFFLKNIFKLKLPYYKFLKMLYSKKIKKG